MKGMVLSQDDQLRTQSTVCEISRKTGIPQSSVVRITRKDLQHKCFKRWHAPELTEANCTARKLLLKKFRPIQFAADFIVLTDERVDIGRHSEQIVKIS